MIVPETLRWLEGRADGAAWLERLPGLVDEVLGLWALVPVGGAMAGNVSYVLPVARGGEPMVLKLQFPHEECAHEAAALVCWNGDGAVRLLGHDPERHALLLEACRPGTLLADAGLADPLGVFTALLPRLWKPVGAPFRPLVEEARGWASSLEPDWANAGRPCERRLVDLAIGRIGDLVASEPEQVLLHQDLHGHNVLAAEREPWLAIDPKPLRGERAFALAPIVRSFELGHARDAVRYRLDRLAAELGVDRERARGWTIAQTMAWSFDSTYAAYHHDTVRWLADS